MGFALVCVVAAMSFADIIRGPPVAKAAAVHPQRRLCRNEKYEVVGQLALGERACSFIYSEYGEERAALLLEALVRRRMRAADLNGTFGSLDDAAEPHGPQPSTGLPYRFWRRFSEEEVGTQYTKRHKQKFMRALHL